MRSKQLAIALLISWTLVVVEPPALQALTLLESDVVSGDAPYFITRDANTSIIFSADQAPAAKMSKAHMTPIFLRYDDLFSWQLDQPLFIGLASSHNQIANGFSTQLPFNKQVNYPAGSAKVDYFCATSWLDLLLTHESTHNYQMNLKDNAVSKGLFSLFRNGYLMVPTFTIPNAVESSFLLEGNAVFHESIWGNGGRLFNGRLYAQTLLQAEAGYLNAPRMYNATFFFPYGEHFYAQGGFFWLYLAQRFGVKRANSYFVHHSRDWFWPFITNANFELAMGRDFESLLYDFSQVMRQQAKQMQRTHAKEVARSKFFYPLNRNEQQVYFLINEQGYTRPKSVRIERATQQIKQESGSWQGGRLFEVDAQLYSDSSMPIHYSQIAYGLFDSKANLLAGSAGRSYAPSLQFNLAQSPYIDINRSFERMVVRTSHAIAPGVASSLFEDASGNVYYFAQDKAVRTLYKNATPLFSMKGHYGFVCDVDEEGGIYFIANSTFGSSLYRLKANQLMRMSQADDIVDMRLLDKRTMLVAVVRSDTYAYLIDTMSPIAQQPASVSLHVPIQSLQPASTFANDSNNSALETQPYNAVSDMHYSGLTLLLGSNENSTLYDVRANFADALSRDSASLYARRDSYGIDSAGAVYKNAASRLNVLLHAFAVTSEHEAIIETADSYGYEARAALILARQGYDSTLAQASYVKEYTSQSRMPLEMQLSHTHNERFGISAFSNRAYTLNVYGVQDRNALYGGASASYQHELPWQSFMRVQAQYSGATIRKINDDMGIKIASQSVERSAIVMPGADFLTYVKHAAYGGATVGTVFDASLYFFTFPISLRRETVSLEMRRYALFSSATQLDVDEWFAKATLDLFWFNKASIPFTILVGRNSARLSEQRNFARFAFQLAF